MQWGTPRASDGAKGGPNQRGSKGDLALSAQAGGSLNPEWVEMLMGFPPGWTAIAGPTAAEKRKRKASRRARSLAAPSPIGPPE